MNRIKAIVLFIAVLFTAEIYAQSGVPVAPGFPSQHPYMPPSPTHKPAPDTTLKKKEYFPKPDTAKIKKAKPPIDRNYGIREDSVSEE